MRDLTPSDLVQTDFFRLLFDKRSEHMTKEMAFATAIVDSSDEKFAEAKEKRPELIENYLDIRRSVRHNRAVR